MDTTSPELKCWVPDADGHKSFPIQNLPFGIFKTRYLSAVAGVAIGPFILDLVYLHENGFLDGLGLPPGVFNQNSLNNFLALGKEKCDSVRERLSELLRHDNDELRDNKIARDIALVPMAEAQMLMPVRVPNYTDFYSSREHATNVGSMFRDPKNALLPNWKHLPVAYHGRASSIVVSGTPIKRPHGQVKPVDSDAPVFKASSKLDFEVELAFITCANTELGSPVAIQSASDHIFGFVLFNDWSARDIQQWEYVPLGPFLGKNFASTISPWIVTMAALEPFRVEGPKQEPAVLPYLSIGGKRNFDITIDTYIQSAQIHLEQDHDRYANLVSRTNFRHMYWNVDQQLAHHTVNGCNLQVGDMMASGTISGPSENSFGSMLELTWNGQKPIQLKDGSTRDFLKDGDTVIMTAYAEKDGVRIGFGECVGTIKP